MGLIQNSTIPLDDEPFTRSVGHDQDFSGRGLGMRVLGIWRYDASHRKNHARALYSILTLLIPFLHSLNSQNSLNSITSIKVSFSGLLVITTSHLNMGLRHRSYRPASQLPQLRVPYLAKRPSWGRGCTAQSIATAKLHIRIISRPKYHTTSGVTPVWFSKSGHSAELAPYYSV